MVQRLHFLKGALHKTDMLIKLNQTDSDLKGGFTRKMRFIFAQIAD